MNTPMIFLAVLRSSSYAYGSKASPCGTNKILSPFAMTSQSGLRRFSRKPCLRRKAMSFVLGFMPVHCIAHKFSHS
jgi:hypothetical protein